MKSTASATGNGLANTLYAGDGNNTLNGGSGIDTASYLFATGGVTSRWSMRMPMFLWKFPAR